MSIPPNPEPPKLPPNPPPPPMLPGRAVAIAVSDASSCGQQNHSSELLPYVRLLIVTLAAVEDVQGPLLWSSGQSFWLQIQRSRVLSPALPDFLSSSGSGTGSTQPREPREVN